MSEQPSFLVSEERSVAGNFAEPVSKPQLASTVELACSPEFMDTQSAGSLPGSEPAAHVAVPASPDAMPASPDVKQATSGTETVLSQRALSAFQQTEVLIQYGHLEEDLQQLSMATQRQKERAHELQLAVMVCIAAPFVTVESLFAAAKNLCPSLLIQFGGAFTMLHSHTDEFYLEHAHGLMYGLGGPLLILTLVIFALYRLHAIGPWGILAPTHIGILPDGLRRHWRSFFLDWTPGTRPWSEVKSVEIREYGKKNHRKKITLRYERSSPLSIEVTGIRRTFEKEALANALRHYLPEQLQGELKLLLEKTLPKQNRYTEIWTQALLNRPQRLLLTALAPQTTLHEGRYTIKEQIGAGGQGTAYLASADGLVSEVVLKEYVLPDHNNVHDRRRALKRLEDEVQILSRLNHPQIVSLHDVFIEDHRAYLVLDYIDGPSLKSIVSKEGKLELARVIELSLQMCSMLKYLHALSPPLVHQDFTPDNLLLTKSGVLKLVDFNVAKESATTKTSLVVGKQSYMPPEQFRGKTSVQSDIYAMGASLYYLLAGVEPEPLTASHPIKVRSEVPEELDRIIAKSTSLEPDSRYATALDLESDLQRLHDSLSALDASVPEAEA